MGVKIRRSRRTEFIAVSGPKMQKSDMATNRQLGCHARRFTGSTRTPYNGTRLETADV